MVEGESTKNDKANTLENRLTAHVDKILEKFPSTYGTPFVSIEDVPRTSQAPPRFNLSTTIPQNPIAPIFHKTILSSSPFHRAE